MKSEIKQRWLAALRSGKYPQTTGRLNRIAQDSCRPEQMVGFCCLGVLCDVVDSAKWEPSLLMPGTLTHGGMDMELPSAVWLGTGIDESDPKVTIPGDHPLFERLPDDLKKRGHALNYWFRLSGLNDGGCDFALMADIIEQFVAVTG